MPDPLLALLYGSNPMFIVHVVFTIGAVVGLTSTTASLLEGDLGTTDVTFCVQLESSIRLERAVVLDLETVQLTASKQAYYFTP